MIQFLNVLSDEQLFAIYETIVRAVLSALLKREVLTQSDALRDEEQQIVRVLSERGQHEKQVALYKSIRTELFAAWQKAKVVQSVG